MTHAANGQAIQHQLRARGGPFGPCASVLARSGDSPRFHRVIQDLDTLTARSSHPLSTPGRSRPAERQIDHSGALTKGSEADYDPRVGRAARRRGEVPVDCSVLARWAIYLRTLPAALAGRRREFAKCPGARTLALRAERIIDAVLTQWLPRQRQLAHPMRDVTMEVRRNCKRAGIKPVSRATVARRWEALRAQQAFALADEPGAAIPPGHLIATKPLELVQIDHTQADVFVVDEAMRRAIGRPWLSVAIDVASRAVVGIYLAMERPNAATVALLLTRVALPKAGWLASLGLDDVDGRCCAMGPHRCAAAGLRRHRSRTAPSARHSLALRDRSSLGRDHEREMRRPHAGRVRVGG
jgi:transposase InsO family protein